MSKKRRKAGTEISEQQPESTSQPAGQEPVRLRLHTAEESEVEAVADVADETAAAGAPVTETREAAEPDQPATPTGETPATDESSETREEAAASDATLDAGDEVAESAPVAEAASKPETSPESGEQAAARDEASRESSEASEAAPAAEAGESAEGAMAELPEGEINIQQVVEAILFSTETPLTPQKIVSVLGVGSVRDEKAQITALNERYEQQGAAFRIEKIAGGYQLLSMPQFNTWIRRLRQARQESRFSAAALETLAVVAYKQPVVRAEVEAIRGVSAGEMLNRLRELGLVKIVGRAEDVGRPMLYGTTKRFLELFGLASLEDLPSVEQLQPPK